MSTIESVLKENRVFPPSHEWQALANIAGKQAYQTLCQEAEENYLGFWQRLALEQLTFTKPFTQVLDDSQAPFYRWFPDAELNVSANCLDRQVANGLGEKIALVFESDDGEVTQITYQDLLTKVCKLANGLLSLGIQLGDCVVIYMPMSIEGIAAMLACARIGATHSVVFAGFSAKSLQARIDDVGAVAILTANEQVRGGKTLPLKQIVDEALSLSGAHTVKQVVVYQRTANTVPMNSQRDCFLDHLVATQPDWCVPTAVSAEHPLFILPD